MNLSEFVLTLKEFLEYKPLNIDIHPDLIKYINRRYKTNKTKYKKRSNEWTRIESNKNWLLKKRRNSNEDEKIKGKLMEYCNKLSKKNYDTIRDRLINLKLENETQLNYLVSIIFSKAISEKTYCILYTNICKDLIISGKHNIITVSEGKKKHIKFRIIFLLKCQTMFKQILEIENDDAIENSFFVYKDKVVGYAKFIGELYNAKLLAAKIMYNCMNQMCVRSNPKSTFLIACMCELMKIIGKRFFRESIRLQKDKTNKININMAEDCFNRLVNLKNEECYRLKEKFAIEDIIDMRKKERW